MAGKRSVTQDRRFAPRAALARVLAVLLATALLAAALPAGSTYAQPGSVPAAAGAAFSAPAGYIVEGTHINPVVGYSTEITNFGNATGKQVGMIMYFRIWDHFNGENLPNHDGPCDDGFLPRQVDVGTPAKPGSASGRTVILTWQPLPNIPGDNLGSPGASDYDNILSGHYNTLIDACANELKAWSNKIFLVRFMHEFNITDSPYWAGFSYNQKGDGTGDTEKFKQVWRYVWQRFKNINVPNVQWVWSPNYASNPNVAWNDMNNYYPGDQYVDWVGLSGFNWMTTGPYQSFNDLFGGVLADLQCRYAKPIILAEIGAAPSGKEGWITDAYQQVRNYPLVRAISWFNDYAFHDPGSVDFRVRQNSGDSTSVPASVTTAYKNAIANSSFTSTFNSSQLLNPPSTRCPGDDVSSNGVLSARPSSAVVARQGATVAHFSIAAMGLGSSTNFVVTNCPGATTCVFQSSGLPASTTRAAPWSSDTLNISTTSASTLGLRTLTISGGGTSVTVQLSVVQKIYASFMPIILP